MARDVRLGFVGRDAALRDYGVVLREDGSVDPAATGARRADAAQPPAPRFDYGPERRAWESVFDDVTMREVNRRLALLPKPQRQTIRRRLFDAVAPGDPGAPANSLRRIVCRSRRSARAPPRRHRGTLAGMTSTPAVELRQVWRRYGAIAAVHDVSLLVEGEFFCFLGPSGCGKSTTLRIIGGFDTPTEGGILIRGAPMNAVPPHRRPTNMVFQQLGPFPSRRFR